MIKLGVRVTSGCPGLDHPTGTLWAPQSTQGLSSPSCKHRLLGRCLQWIGVWNHKGSSLLHLPYQGQNSCNLQMPGLHPQWLFLPVLGSFPRQGVRIKSCPAKGLCLNLACKVISKLQRWCAKETAETHLPMIYPERCERSLAVGLHTQNSPDVKSLETIAAHLKFLSTQESVTSSHWHKNICRRVTQIVGPAFLHTHGQ